MRQRAFGKTIKNFFESDVKKNIINRDIKTIELNIYERSKKYTCFVLKRDREHRRHISYFGVFDLSENAKNKIMANIFDRNTNFKNCMNLKNAILKGNDEDGMFIYGVAHNSRDYDEDCFYVDTEYGDAEILIHEFKYDRDILKDG